MKEIFCRVVGRVQMVMYRDFAARNAKRFGLVGYVKNIPDGTVEVLAQGAEDALKNYIARLERGSLLSRVDKVEVQWREPSERLSNFVLVR